MATTSADPTKLDRNNRPTPNDTKDNTTDNTSNESPQDILARSTNGEIPNDPDEGYIVHRVQYVDNEGTTRTREHGPMPRGEWADYQREHNL